MREPSQEASPEHFAREPSVQDAPRGVCGSDRANMAYWMKARPRTSAWKALHSTHGGARLRTDACAVSLEGGGVPAILGDWKDMTGSFYGGSVVRISDDHWSVDGDTYVFLLGETLSDWQASRQEFITLAGQRLLSVSLPSLAQ